MVISSTDTGVRIARAARSKKNAHPVITTVSDGRASIWNDQGLDGGDAFPHQVIGTRQNGNEPARTRLQPKAGNEDHGNRRAVGGNAGLRGSCLSNFR